MNRIYLSPRPEEDALSLTKVDFCSITSPSSSRRVDDLFSFAFSSNHGGLLPARGSDGRGRP